MDKYEQLSRELEATKNKGTYINILNIADFSVVPDANVTAEVLNMSHPAALRGLKERMATTSDVMREKANWETDRSKRALSRILPASGTILVGGVAKKYAQTIQPTTPDTANEKGSYDAFGTTLIVAGVSAALYKTFQYFAAKKTARMHVFQMIGARNNAEVIGDIQRKQAAPANDVFLKDAFNPPA